MKRVSDIRSTLKKGGKVCDETPGWYRWWCDKEAASRLLKPLEVDIDKLSHKNIDGKECVAIYFGISTKGKGLNGRLKWHICQEHRPSAVINGTLSTFRQSLSALLGKKMVNAEAAINAFMDEHCFLEFHNANDAAEAKAMESQELNNGAYFYPINIQDAKGTPEKVRKRLKELRKTYKS